MKEQFFTGGDIVLIPEVYDPPGNLRFVKYMHSYLFVSREFNGFLNFIFYAKNLFNKIIIISPFALYVNMRNYEQFVVCYRYQAYWL